jgi:hypothetical protein
MTPEQKQEFINLVELNRNKLSMSLGNNGQSMNFVFCKRDEGMQTVNYSCKEALLTVIGTKNYPTVSKECVGILGTPDTINRTIQFWARKNLPDFDKEIIKLTDEITILLIFLDSEIFKMNLLYLDVLSTMTRLFSKEKEKVKNITNLIPNTESYFGLQDGTKLILNTPPEVVQNLKIHFINMPAAVGGGTGVGKAFKYGILPKAIEEYQK